MSTVPDETRVDFWRQELSAYGGLRNYEKRHSHPTGLREALAFERAACLELEESQQKEIQRLTKIEHAAQYLLDAWKASDELREEARRALQLACYPNLNYDTKG